VDDTLRFTRGTSVCWCGSRKPGKDCCGKKKPRTVRVKADVSQMPRNSLEIRQNSQTGELKFINGGQAVAPGPAVLQLHYEKSRGRIKPTLRIPIVGGRVCTTVESAIEGFDFFMAVDTNTSTFGSEKISVTCAVLESVNKSTRQLAAVAGWLIEHRDVAINPEKLGWGAAVWLLCCGVHGVPGWGPAMKIGIITDHDSNALDAINARTKPLFADQLLPECMTMIYASTDQRDTAINELLYWADQKATLLMKHIVEHPHEQWDEGVEGLYRVRRFWTGPVADRILYIPAATRRAAKL
jgi:hypothetical protein